MLSQAEAVLPVRAAIVAWPARWALMAGIAYGMAATVGLRPPVDLDVWWHLRTGAWIVEHGTVPLTDPFATFGAGKPWVAYSWLFELILLALYRMLGLAGVVLFGVCGALATALVLHAAVARYEKRVPHALALVVTSVAAMAPVFWPRSYIFSIVFFTLLLAVLLVVRESGRARLLVVVPVLMAAWANFHIQFVYGLFLLGVAAVAPWLERRLPERWAGNPSCLGAAPFVVTLVASAAATLATPYHVRLYRALIEHITQTDTFDLIIELQAPAFRSLPDWLVLALLLGAVVTMSRASQVPPFFVLLLAAATFVSFRAARDVWFVVIVSAVTIASTQRVEAVRRYRASATMTAASIAVAACVLGGFVFAQGMSPRTLESAVAERFPVNAVKVVEQRGYAGPLFNHYDWGGYLIWALPRLPVSMDGRANVYGPEKIRKAAETWSGVPGWDTDPDLKEARLVIAAPRLPLSELLRRSAEFEVAWEDRVAVVFVARR